MRWADPSQRVRGLLNLVDEANPKDLIFKDAWGKLMVEEVALLAFSAA